MLESIELLLDYPIKIQNCPIVENELLLYQTICCCLKIIQLVVKVKLEWLVLWRCPLQISNLLNESSPYIFLCLLPFNWMLFFFALIRWFRMWLLWSCHNQCLRNWLFKNCFYLNTLCTVTVPMNILRLAIGRTYLNCALGNFFQKDCIKLCKSLVWITWGSFLPVIVVNNGHPSFNAMLTLNFTGWTLTMTQ